MCCTVPARGQGQVRLNEEMGERRGWEHRDGFRAEHFPSRRLWLIVPLPCTHRTRLSNCSSEWGHCLSAAQGEQLSLAKLDSALAYWVLGRKREMQPGLLYIWHLHCSFGCSEYFTDNPKGSSVAEDWQFLLVLQPGCCVYPQRNILDNSSLRAHRQKEKIRAHPQSCWVGDGSSLLRVWISLCKTVLRLNLCILILIQK